MKRSALWILGGLIISGTAQAQPAQIQAIRPSGAENLSRNLSRLASNPRDVDALIGAGEAAVEMDDMRAAAGFFGRADAIQPNSGRVKAGLGRVMLKTQNPAEALRLFDQATRLGFGEATLLADRGLARDMTGDQAGAQRDYQAALKRAPQDSELLYRYAASLGISGQVDAAEKVLQPLLYKSDRGAWRYRAFIMAMNNKQNEARKIASQTMPPSLASALTPYMQKMPYLTPAQKAAAVHFGRFPTTVGTSMAAAAPAPTQSAPVAAAPERPVTVPAQAGARQALASNARVQRVKPERPTRSPAPAPMQSAPTQPQPAPASVPAPSSLAQTPPPVRQAEIQGPPASASVPSRPTVSAIPATEPGTAAATQLPTTQRPPATAVAASAPRQQPNPEATRSLADIIRAIDVPEEERRPTVSAVDLAEIAALQAAQRAEQQAEAEVARKAAAAAKAKAAAAAKAKAEADAKAKKAAEEKARLTANPSRNWVQIGIGADRGALAFTLKNLRRKYDDVAPQDGWVASWGRTNRLLIGPFASFTRAKSVESKLKSAGADAFAWQSEAGEVVERLGGK